jgi:hypothetical protein
MQVWPRGGVVGRVPAAHRAPPRDRENATPSRMLPGCPLACRACAPSPSPPPAVSRSPRRGSTGRAQPPASAATSGTCGAWWTAPTSCSSTRSTCSPGHTNCPSGRVSVRTTGLRGTRGCGAPGSCTRGGSTSPPAPTSRCGRCSPTAVPRLGATASAPSCATTRPTSTACSTRWPRQDPCRSRTSTTRARGTVRGGGIRRARSRSTSSTCAATSPSTTGPRSS